MAPHRAAPRRTVLTLAPRRSKIPKIDAAPLNLSGAAAVRRVVLIPSTHHQWDLWTIALCGIRRNAPLILHSSHTDARCSKSKITDKMEYFHIEWLNRIGCLSFFHHPKSHSIPTLTTDIFVSRHPCDEVRVMNGKNSYQNSIIKFSFDLYLFLRHFDFGNAFNILSVHFDSHTFWYNTDDRSDSIRLLVRTHTSKRRQSRVFSLSYCERRGGCTRYGTWLRWENRTIEYTKRYIRAQS